ncbi:hypothetical protein [Mycobacteroides abscessus]|uniref:hypothetical protein n=1 Tax=Mycobacteroides abscessus TaxID=36809 RepID=UPI00092B0507|nr:hypothetical protein [Mycobacteroides abscessus]SHQ49184.1 Uncharacterised protein [Mycobacteroides abscessus subsp. abscessus]SKQ84692.1 Uncharacterised protein [Mycobacteroides abscessus subsp. massiliense]SLC49374.1 Uncharacterised protein [Mycobacteroides abscessus subsp. massiliense]
MVLQNWAAQAAPTVEIVAGQVRDGTAHNYVGELVAVGAGIAAAAIVGAAIWFLLKAFWKGQGKFTTTVPEGLGILGAAGFFGVFILKIPSWLGFSNTWLSDLAPWLG